MHFRVFLASEKNVPFVNGSGSGSEPTGSRIQFFGSVAALHPFLFNQQMPLSQLVLLAIRHEFTFFANIQYDGVRHAWYSLATCDQEQSPSGRCRFYALFDGFAGN